MVWYEVEEWSSALGRIRIIVIVRHGCDKFEECDARSDWGLVGRLEMFVVVIACADVSPVGNSLYEESRRCVAPVWVRVLLMERPFGRATACSCCDRC